MAKILKFKRGNTAKNNAYTGSAGELTVDTSKKTVVVHDGVTAGGSVLATEQSASNPSNIVQDSTHRFVTDSDKTNWNGKINATEKAVANGVATLDVNGKVVLTQIPDSVLGQLEYMGTYSFLGGMPIATQKGQYWIASVDGNGYITGDWAVWNGTSFDKVDNTDAVATVAGRTGNVVLTKNDVGLNNVDNTSDADKPISTATQNALGLKANAASAVLTGIPKAPTAAVGTNTTQLATTAFVNAEIANDTYSKTQLDSGQLDNRYYTEAEIDAKLNAQNAASEIGYSNTTSGLVATKVQGAIDEVEGRLDVAETKIANANISRADKYLASQNIANMLYTNGNLTKIQYKNATDVDYELLGYSGGNLSTIQHYVGSVLKGTTTLSYGAGNFVSAVFVAV